MAFIISQPVLGHEIHYIAQNDLKGEKSMFRGQTLLITGGTGSFGGAVLDRFLDTEIGEIRIFSRDEKKQHDMREKYNNSKVKYYVGDVRDKSSIDFAMRGVDLVFHAAALKQVPSCEFYPLEAVKTNILGTENVLDSAIANQVGKVIVLSTDKAVYPINAMGISKSMMEKVMVAKSRFLKDEGDTVLIGTRYGNVMGSRGSVVPLFVDQIRKGQSLTVTDPNMTRFLMSLDEAVDLVLFAFENGQQGDLFVQKSPACTVGVLVEALKKIFSIDSEVKYIGTRPGEKQYESLLTREELFHSEDLGRYYRVPVENKDLDAKKFFESGDRGIDKQVEYNSNNTEQLSVDQVIERLKSVPVVQHGLVQ